MKKCLVISAMLAAFSVSALAGELAVLRNGFTIHHERCEVRGEVTRLYLQSSEDSGYVDVPTSEIVSFEGDPDPPPPVAAKTVTIQDSVNSASRQTGIDPEFINSVIRAESGFNPHAVSNKGAQGLMQLMPATAARLGVKNSFDPQANVQAGSQYLRELLLRYHSNVTRALAAYNAGPQHVAQYHGMPPFPETSAYVSRVIREFNRRKLAQSASQKQKAMHAAASPNSKPTPSVKATSAISAETGQ